MEKENKYLILTSMCDCSNFDYNDYTDWCEDNNIEPKGENSDDFYEWCADETNYNYEADMENIKYHKSYDVPVVISGILGLWDGNHEIVPVEMNNVAEAIEKCIPGGCYSDIDVYWEDGLIEVYAHHHDGTNHFTISPKYGTEFDYLYA